MRITFTQSIYPHTHHPSHYPLKTPYFDPKVRPTKETSTDSSEIQNALNMQNLQRRIHRNVGCSIVSPLFFPNSSNGVSSSSTTELSQAHSNPSQAHSKLASAPSRFIYRPPRPQTTPTKRRVGTYLNSRAEAVCLGVNWSDFEGVTNPCRQLFYSQNHPNSTPISGPPHSTPKQHKTHKKKSHPQGFHKA